MRRLLLHGALFSAAVLPLTGCVATKDWVKEVVGKQEARTEQRLGSVDARVGDVNSRLDTETRRLEGRVGGLEGQLGETTGMAREAKTRADEAYGRADEVNGRLTRLWSNRHKRNLVDTVHVQFAFDRADLSDSAQTALLAVIKELKENPQLTVDLEGFTDQVGAREYNIALSQRRVEAVRRYLIKHGADMPRIQAVGFGMVDGDGLKDEAAKQRRVTLKLMIGTD